MPLGFVAGQVFPYLGRVLGRYAVFQKISGDVRRHEGTRCIPRAGNHDRITAVIEYVHQMALERGEIATAMEGNETSFVKAHFGA